MAVVIIILIILDDIKMLFFGNIELINFKLFIIDFFHASFYVFSIKMQTKFNGKGVKDAACVIDLLKKM